MVSPHDVVVAEEVECVGHLGGCDDDPGHGATLSLRPTCQGRHPGSGPRTPPAPHAPGLAGTAIHAVCNNCLMQSIDNPGTPRAAETGDLADEAVEATRVLVDIAARSLLGVGDDITLPQYRVLVLVDGGETMRGVDLSRALGIHASTSSRLVNRLVVKGLMDRTPDAQDRRSNSLAITAAGHRLVSRVNYRRRREMRGLLEHLGADEISAVLDGLRLFNAAAVASGHGTPAPPEKSDDRGRR
ncbi:Transcriptional regulator, MarR family [Acidipropionibacterium acidipropionici ATCC 4875]|uniref:Transcriptional regulator, MarR family n=2 Tax=Acidipropionibacterium acidipropionici TaxID=1748 RepID=K7S8Z5_ACIA4|nr:Transcriptional regulator, MarR family [Acidipropionibacterium acidipropionici ATCC 4875]